MKKTLGVISIILFIISAVLATSDYVFPGGLLSTEDQADVFIYILATTIPPVVGFTLAFFSKKRALKITGIIGNGAVMMLTIVLPLAIDIFFPLQ